MKNGLFQGNVPKQIYLDYRPLANLLIPFYPWIRWKIFITLYLNYSGCVVFQEIKLLWKASFVFMYLRSKPLGKIFHINIAILKVMLITSFCFSNMFINSNSWHRAKWSTYIVNRNSIEQEHFSSYKTIFSSKKKHSNIL